MEDERRVLEGVRYALKSLLEEVLFGDGAVQLAAVDVVEFLLEDPLFGGVVNEEGEVWGDAVVCMSYGVERDNRSVQLGLNRTQICTNDHGCRMLFRYKALQ